MAATYLGHIADLGNQTTYTGGDWNFNVGGADVSRRFIIAVEGGFATRTITSVAGGAAAEIIQSLSGGTGVVTVGLFSLTATPSSGIISVPVVWSGAQTHCFAQIWEVTGGAHRLVDFDVSTADPQDVTLTSISGGFAIACCAQRAVTPIDPAWSGSGVTDRYDTANVETNDRFGAADVDTTGATQNIVCDTTTDSRRVMVAASFAPLFITAAAGAYTLTGQDAALLAPKSVSADAGVYSISRSPITHG